MAFDEFYYDPLTLNTFRTNKEFIRKVEVALNKKARENGYVSPSEIRDAMLDMLFDSQDTEWMFAEKRNETPNYYWVETGVRSNPMWDGNADHGGRFVKCYKPSVAKLVAERTGYRIYPVK